MERCLCSCACCLLWEITAMAVAAQSQDGAGRGLLSVTLRVHHQASVWLDTGSTANSLTAAHHSHHGLLSQASQPRERSGAREVFSVCLSVSPLLLPRCFQGLCRLLAPAAHAEVHLLPKARECKCCGSVCNLTLCRCVQAGFLYPSQLQITVHKP